MTPLLTVEHLSKHYEGRRGLIERVTGVPHTVVRAVNDVSLTVDKGEILGLIGESGCGKVHAWARHPAAQRANCGKSDL